MFGWLKSRKGSKATTVVDHELMEIQQVIATVLQKTLYIKDRKFAMEKALPIAEVISLRQDAILSACGVASVEPETMLDILKYLYIVNDRFEVVNANGMLYKEALNKNFGPESDAIKITDAQRRQLRITQAKQNSQPALMADSHRPVSSAA